MEPALSRKGARPDHASRSSSSQIGFVQARQPEASIAIPLSGPDQSATRARFPRTARQNGRAATRTSPALTSMSRKRGAARSMMSTTVTLERSDIRLQLSIESTLLQGLAGNTGVRHESCGSFWNSQALVDGTYANTSRRDHQARRPAVERRSATAGLRVGKPVGSEGHFIERRSGVRGSDQRGDRESEAHGSLLGNATAYHGFAFADLGLVKFPPGPPCD